MFDRPGIPFVSMLNLIQSNHRRLFRDGPTGPEMPNPFTPQVLMAIFWEETFFTNRKQKGSGTAIGFGQVEPSELGHLGDRNAADCGYKVEGAFRGMGPVDDDRSVQLSSCMLLHLFVSSNKGLPVAMRKQLAYENYAGVQYAKTHVTPLSPAERLAIIERWKACETKLLGLPFTERDIGMRLQQGNLTALEDQYLGALKSAKGFLADRKFKQTVGPLAVDVTFRELVFPNCWWLRAYVNAIAPENFLPPGNFLQLGSTGAQVGFLQNVLNVRRQPADSKLVEDGIFGSKTQAAVRTFQQRQGLQTDGIVGPMTRAKLV